MPAKFYFVYGGKEKIEEGYNYYCSKINNGTYLENKEVEYQNICLLELGFFDLIYLRKNCDKNLKIIANIYLGITTENNIYQQFPYFSKRINVTRQLSTINEILEKEPENLKYLQERAQILFNLQRFYELALINNNGIEFFLFTSNVHPSQTNKTFWNSFKLLYYLEEHKGLSVTEKKAHIENLRKNQKTNEERGIYLCFKNMIDWETNPCALVELKSSLLLIPAICPVTYSILTQLYIKIYKYEEAKECFEKCIKFEKQNGFDLSLTYYNFAEFFAERKLYEKAKEYYDLSIDLQRDDNYKCLAKIKLAKIKLKLEYNVVTELESLNISNCNEEILFTYFYTLLEAYIEDVKRNASFHSKIYNCAKECYKFSESVSKQLFSAFLTSFGHYLDNYGSKQLAFEVLLQGLLVSFKSKNPQTIMIALNNFSLNIEKYLSMDSLSNFEAIYALMLQFLKRLSSTSGERVALVKAFRTSVFNLERALITNRVFDKALICQERVRSYNLKVKRNLLEQLISLDIKDIHNIAIDRNSVIVSYSNGNMYIILPSKNTNWLHYFRYSEKELNNLIIGDIFEEDTRAQLYSLLINPFEGLVHNYHHITFIIEANMYKIPFAGLLNSNEELLIEKFAISFSPSILLLKEETKINFSKTALFTVANDLSCGKKEVNGLNNLLVEHNFICQTFCDKSAIFNNIENSGIVHFVLHGDPTIKSVAHKQELDYEFHVEGGLLISRTSDEPLIFAKDLEQTDLTKVFLLTLSGCDTGKGLVVSGEGVLGFVYASLSSGAHSVISAISEIKDNEAYTIMTLFYKNLLNKNCKSKAVALQNAILESLKKNKKLKFNPKTWSAIQLWGNDKPF